MKKKWVIIADDFTGAADTGVQFANAGLQVKVIINASAIAREIKACDVLVIDLETRLISAKEAYNKHYDVGKQLHNIGNCMVYKKLDSTLRGNIGSEIDGLMDSMNFKMTLLAPALPVYGRTVVNGEVLVNNVKLSETEVRNDPRTPVLHSCISDIIDIQSNRRCKAISTAFLNNQPGKRTDYLLKEFDSGNEVLIFDSTTEDDLEKIVETIGPLLHQNVLLAGSAGLARYVSKFSLECQKRIAFAFSGSISGKTRSQIKFLENENDTAFINMAGEKLLNGMLKINEIIADVSSKIAGGVSRFIFVSALTKHDVDAVNHFAKEQAISKEEAAGRLSVEMGRFAATLIKKFKPFGVLLTGGETAINTVHALGATGIKIDREILPGIQCGTLTGCAVKSLVVTKAGGFGSNDAILKTFQFFKV